MPASILGKSSGELPHWPVHLFLILASVVTVYPILWVFAVAFSGQQDLDFIDLPAQATTSERLRAVVPWPETVTGSSFVSLFTEQPFARWLVNSAIVSAATTFVGVFLACTAGYAFSRFKFPGHRAGLLSFMVSRMLPGALTLIPLYIVIVHWMGLGSNYLGLVLVYSSTATPFCVWMLKGYFDTIPKEIEESARIDGASTATIFTRIILPQARPAVAVTALVSFMTAWNEFMLALVFLDRPVMFTAPVGLRFFVDGFAEPQWGYFAAGSIIATLPVIVIFIFLRKHFVSGLPWSGKIMNVKAPAVPPLASSYQYSP